MPLQNRVTPFGEIVALEGRGLVLGNRGILHDDARRIVRCSQVRRWLACRLEFRGRHRTPMTPHSYTELFFLDEATALAAGHRPCSECRHHDYLHFAALWNRCHGGAANAGTIDRTLERERRAGRRKLTYPGDVAALPDGAYIADPDAWLIFGDELLAWSDVGYSKRRPRPPHGNVDVLTPRSTVGVLRAGYKPDVHPSAYDR